MAGKRTKLILDVFRCGETDWERDQRLLGASNLPLSDRGRAAVAHEAGRLGGRRIATIYAPEDDAAAETATMLARAARARTKSSVDLADPSLGLYEGLHETAFAERYPRRWKQWQEDPLALAPPEGEPLAAARARLLLTAVKLLRKTRATTIGMVLHPIALGFLRCSLASRPTKDLWAMVNVRRGWERYVVPMQMLEKMELQASEDVAAFGKKA